MTFIIVDVIIFLVYEHLKKKRSIIPLCHSVISQLDFLQKNMIISDYLNITNITSKITTTTEINQLLKKTKSSKKEKYISIHNRLSNICCLSNNSSNAKYHPKEIYMEITKVRYILNCFIYENES